MNTKRGICNKSLNKAAAISQSRFYHLRYNSCPIPSFQCGKGALFSQHLTTSLNAYYHHIVRVSLWISRVAKGCFWHRPTILNIHLTFTSMVLPLICNPRIFGMDLTRFRRSGRTADLFRVPSSIFQRSRSFLPKLSLMRKRLTS